MGPQGKTIIVFANRHHSHTVLATLSLLSYTNYKISCWSVFHYCRRKQWNQIYYLVECMMEMYATLKESTSLSAFCSSLLCSSLTHLLSHLGLGSSQRLSTKCFAAWVLKLKPFFDAHYGPLKDKHRY